MLKKLLLMATMIAAIAALFAASAQATFTNSSWAMGGTELRESGTIEGTGQLNLNSTSGLGGIECHTAIHSNLRKESSTGEIAILLTTNCMTFGFLATVCGTNMAGTPTLPWELHAQKTGASKRILITGPVLHTVMLEPTPNCPNGGKINITGSNSTNPVVFIPDNGAAFTKLTLGGEINTTIGASKAEGVVTLSSGSGTYGIL